MNGIMKKVFVFAVVAAMIAALAVGLAACEPDETAKGGALRVAAPEGTPALAIARLVTDNKTIADYSMTYEVVAASNIAVEMSAEKADVVIMPVNAGANLIRQGAKYKLACVAVDGSLFMVGNVEGGGAIDLDDIVGKKVACIGQTGVPGLVFRYVMTNSGITLVDENTEPDASKNEVSVRYVADGAKARPLLASGKVDFAVVGEPAATAFKTALSLNAEMDMQAMWQSATGKETYPQAGLFVKNTLAADGEFMNQLFAALAASKKWVNENPAEVTAFAQENLYASATFPAPSIARCALDATALDEAKKARVLEFLSAVMPKDSGDAAIDWTAVDMFL